MMILFGAIHAVHAELTVSERCSTALSLSLSFFFIVAHIFYHQRPFNGLPGVS